MFCLMMCLFHVTTVCGEHAEYQPLEACPWLCLVQKNSDSNNSSAVELALKQVLASPTLQVTMVKQRV